jgi:autotransporter-associated beta strand protein
MTRIINPLIENKTKKKPMKLTVKKNNALALFTIVLAFLGAAISSFAGSATWSAAPDTAYTWFTSTSGNYSDGTKWSPTGVPLNPGDTGTVPGTATFTVTLDTSPNIDFFTINNPHATFLFTGLNTMTTSGAFTNRGTVEIPSGDNNLLHAGSITNNSGGVIKVDNVSGLHIQTPTLTNNGAITINQSTVGNTTNLNITGDVTLSGSGTVTGSNVIGNNLRGDTGTERLTIGATQTIQGSLTLGNMSFTNNGIFNANVTQGMTLDPITSVGSVNNGTLEASNGSILTLHNSGNGGNIIYTNTNGTIKALASSFVSLSNNPTIVGGTLTTADLTGSGGVIQPFDLATLQDLTNTGFLNIADSTTLDLVGTLTNNGVLMLNSGANGATLRLENDVTITGTGIVSSSNTQQNQIHGQNGTERLTVGSGMTIQGSFTLGFASLRLTNNGVINANLSNGATVRPTDAVGDFVNNGILEASNGSTLSLSSLNITNTAGTIQALASSVVKLNGGGSGTQIAGGTMIANDGSIQYSSFVPVTASARLEVLGTGSFDISDVPGIATVGSIEGNGSIFLGATNLTAGSNNLTTIFSGVMQDGGVNGGAGGSFTKIGTGTLSLSGANTYTGDTTVQGGRLLVSNTTGSATGTGLVQINAAILGGTGTIKGAVIIGVNAKLAPRTGGHQFGVLNLQSALRFKSRATYTFALDTVTHGADMLLAKGVTINNGALFSLVSLGAATLPQGLVFTTISNTATRPIAGTFSNLADGAILTVNGNNFQANYEGGDGNDLTLTVVP